MRDAEGVVPYKDCAKGDVGDGCLPCYSPHKIGFAGTPFIGRGTIGTMVEGFNDIPRTDVGIRSYVITRTSNARPYRMVQAGRKDSSHSFRMTYF